MILTEPIAFVIVGPPRTKGNRPEMFHVPGRGIVRVPSEAYRAWNRSAQMQLMIIKRKLGITEPITSMVWVKAQIFCDKLVTVIGDGDNYSKGLGDALQEAGILRNDRQIVSWNDMTAEKDEKNPRVVFTLTPVEIRPIAG